MTRTSFPDDVPLAQTTDAVVHCSHHINNPATLGDTMAKKPKPKPKPRPKPGMPY